MVESSLVIGKVDLIPQQALPAGDDGDDVRVMYMW